MYTVRVKTEEFRIGLQNKYDALEREENCDIDGTNETITRLISETDIESGGKAPRQEVSELYETTKDSIKNRQHLKATNSISKKFAELTMLINKKVSDISNYNVKEVEAAVKKKGRQHQNS